MNRIAGLAALLLLIMSLAADADAQLLHKPTLSLASAKEVAAAAAESASKNNVGVVIAVVDDGGHLIYLERLDNTVAVSAMIAPGKARTAALFRRPSGELEKTINGGRTALAAVHDYTPLQGGVPIVVQGQTVGAIGVSGANPAQDEEIASAGANAFIETLKRRSIEVRP